MIKKIPLKINKIHSKKIFIHDHQRFFANFLKYNFGKHYDLIISKDENLEIDLHLRKEDYSFIFFVLYSDNDLYDFLNLYTSGVPIIAASKNRQIVNRMNQIPNVITVDLGLSRTKMINEISGLFLLCTL